MKEYKPGWQKAKPVDRVSVNYDPEKTLHIMKLLYLTRERRRSKYWQVLFVSLTRLKKTSHLHRKSYYDGTLDLGILGYNIPNCQSLQDVLRCKDIPMQWPTVKDPNMLSVSLESVNLDPIK